MSAPLLILVTLVYGYVSAKFALDGNPQMGVVFFGYSIANLGFIWEAVK